MVLNASLMPFFFQRSRWKIGAKIDKMGRSDLKIVQICKSRVLKIKITSGRGLDHIFGAISPTPS